MTKSQEINAVEERATRRAQTLAQARADAAAFALNGTRVQAVTKKNKESEVAKENKHKAAMDVAAEKEFR